MTLRLACFSATLAVLLLVFVTVAHAQEPPPGSSAISAASLPATAPWFGQLVDRNAVGSGDTRGQYVSVAFLGSTPYVSYYDVTNTSLRAAWPVASGGNCGSANTWHCETVDNSAEVGKYSSIATSSSGSRVGIAYYDVTNGALKFAERTCYHGVCAWSIVTVDDSTVAFVGAYPSLRYDTAGERHIAYRSNIPIVHVSYLKYAHSVASGGNCGVGAAAGKWQCDAIESGDDLARFNSLDLNGAGQPRIAYYDDGNNILKYAQKGGAGTNCGPGGNTWVCHGIDVIPDVGRFASLAVTKGMAEKPHIAYYNATTGKLRYATYVGSGGNCGLSSISLQFEWQCDTIDAMGAGMAQAGVSLALDNSNRPFIAYQDASAALGPTALRIARPAAALGLLVGNCGPSIPLFPTWQCDFLDGGGAYTDEADYVALAINSAGLSTVAYYESDSYYTTGYLKVIMQRLQAFLPVVRKS